MALQPGSVLISRKDVLFALPPFSTIALRGETGGLQGDQANRIEHKVTSLGGTKYWLRCGLGAGGG